MKKKVLYYIRPGIKPYCAFNVQKYFLVDPEVGYQYCGIGEFCKSVSDIKKFIGQNKYNEHQIIKIDEKCSHVKELKNIFIRNNKDGR